MVETIDFLTAPGVPVLGHVGLMPQSVNAAGFQVQGKTEESARRIRADARAVEAAGAFGIVIENTVELLSRTLTQELTVPTIGIGASPACDGQILVTEDIVGLAGAFTPRFVKRYAELGDGLAGAVREYAADVRARRFPGPEHTANLGGAAGEIQGLRPRLGYLLRGGGGPRDTCAQAGGSIREPAPPHCEHKDLTTRPVMHRSCCVYRSARRESCSAL